VRTVDTASRREFAAHKPSSSCFTISLFSSLAIHSVSIPFFLLSPFSFFFFSSSAPPLLLLLHFTFRLPFFFMRAKSTTDDGKEEYSSQGMMPL
jgi:hypothetical protein